MTVLLKAACALGSFAFIPVDKQNPAHVFFGVGQL
jgi:hypothetical protein